MPKVSAFRLVGTTAFLTVFALSVAMAQTASVNGTVTDSSGALVTGANVSVHNTSTNAARIVQTSGSGVYNVTELQAGPYELTIEKSGFRTVKYSAVTLTVDQALTLNATLEIGATQESVTVEGAAAPVNTTDAELSNVVEHDQMTELPLILRDPYQLVLLGPGVTQSDGYGGVSVNGGRERNNNFLLDGADNNDSEVPGPLGGITTQNPDSTEEFRVITNNFAPEFGRNNGAIIDVITKSGTNRLHGNAFYFGRWDALGARDFFNHQIDPNTGQILPKNPYVRNLYGASLGGPIVKDKTFFFVNYQGDRFVTTLTNSSTVPTTAFSSGVFTFTNPNCATPPCSQSLNIATANTGNNATSVGLDPVMQKILALYPTPTSVNPDGITGQLFFPSESREKDEDAVIKIDQKISTGNSFSARYIYNWFHDPNPFHTDFLPGGLGAQYSFQRTQGLALSLTTNPNPSLVNELRASANRTNLFFGCNGTNVFDSFGYIDQVGRGADFNLPTISGFGCLNEGDANDQERRTGTYQYWDTLTKVIGSHTMKFGGEFRNVYSNNFTDFFSRATFGFSVYSNSGEVISAMQGVNANVDTPELENLVDALLGLVYSQSQTQFFTRNGARLTNDELDFRQRELGLFAQDQWKVLSNLSLTYGLRWEYYGVPFEAHGNLSNLFVDPSGFAPFTFIPVGPGTGHQLYDSYYRNFEPRFGFAWDPFKNGKTSIRGGIGVFSDRVYGNLVSDARGNPPFQPGFVATPVFNFYNGLPPFGQVAQAQLSSQVSPSQVTPSPIVGDYNPSTGSGALFPDLFAHNMKPPSVVTWNFGIQHELTSKLSVEANYVGNHATRILRVVDANPPQPALVAALLAAGVPPSDLQFQTLYIGKEFGILPFDAVNNNAFGGSQSVGTFTDETSGHSWYNGLQTQVIERAAKGLQIQLSYTWSHALDDSSDPLATTAGNGNYPVDSLDLYRERGNSGFDTRQRAVLNFLYRPNIGRGKALLSNGIPGRIFEGWEISGIAAFQTGLPYDIFGFLDTLHTGNADRATVVNSSILKAVPASGRINSGGGVFTGENIAGFNPEDGSIPIPWGVPANVERNAWYGPGVNNWDVSLAKTTSLSERINFQLRFETYNLFNRVQFTKPGNNIGNPSTMGYSFSQAGQNDGTTGARQIQLGAKLVF